MNPNEFMGMLVFSLISIVGLIMVFAKISWNTSSTLTKMSVVLETVVKMADSHTKEITDLKEDMHKIKEEQKLMQQQCNFIHRFDD